MQETPRRVASTQREQRPEPVAPRARADATAELGAEGGSYGELTQHDRAKDQSAAVGGRGQPGRRVLLIGVAAALLILAILAMVFWAGAA